MDSPARRLRHQRGGAASPTAQLNNLGSIAGLGLDRLGVVVRATLNWGGVAQPGQLYVALGLTPNGQPRTGICAGIFAGGAATTPPLRIRIDNSVNGASLNINGPNVPYDADVTVYLQRVGANAIVAAFYDEGGSLVWLKPVFGLGFNYPELYAGIAATRPDHRILDFAVGEVPS